MECKKCKKDLPEEKFSFRNKSKGIRRKECKSCCSEYKKEYYKNNKEKLIKYSTESTKKIRQRNRQFIWNYYKENSCVDCPESDPIVLEFDHREGVEKEYEISKMVTQCYSIEGIKKEIEKCDVRCANCHRKETARKGNWYKDIVK